MSPVNVYRSTRSNPEPAPEPVEIRDGEPELRPDAPRDAALRRPPPMMDVAWTRDLGASFQAQGVLTSGSRVYADGKVQWMLMDGSSGQSLKTGIRGLGPAVLDASLLYQPDADGQMLGLHLDGGQQVFWAPLFFNADMRRPFAARAGNSLLVLGVEREQNPSERPPPPEVSCLDALPVGPTPAVLHSKQLAEGPGPLIWDSPAAMAAGFEGGAAVAFAGRIFLVDESLKVDAVLTGAFTPVALSADEAGVMYLIVDEDGGRRALWVVRPSGVRTVRLALPAPFDKAEAPPLVTHEHGIVVRAPAGLLALTHDGQIAWARRLPADAGALVTADDEVLATDGAQLVSFDRDGQRMVLHRLDEALVGTPALQEGGEVTVATASSKVIRLRPSR